MNKPDKWVIMKLAFEGETIYKVVAGWGGSYLQGASWRTNSGIVSVDYEPETECYIFKGYGDSDYACHKDRYGVDHSNELGHKHLKDRHIKAIEMAVMPKDTNWMTLKYTTC